MVDLKKLQKEVYQNKVNHGFNTTDISYEFCLAYGEVGEAYMAWLKKKDDIGEELADVVIYMMGIAEILNINLEEELQKKIIKNSKRKYINVNGVLVKGEENE
jgi:NTP pyrophosphatase (non-canonical NTP hydrolase)